MSISDTLYLSFVLTKFRGYYIGTSLVAHSPEELDEAANLLTRISFQEDVVNPGCVIGPDEFAGMSGIVGGLPKDGSFKVNPAQRVRVSMSVSQTLLLTKVDPEYPEAARQAGAHGPVVLSAIVGPNGEVQEATALAGDPSLVPAAIAAVKKWKYRPYLLGGQPVTMDTTVDVDFRDRK